MNYCVFSNFLFERYRLVYHVMPTDLNTAMKTFIENDKHSPWPVYPQLFYLDPNLENERREDLSYYLAVKPGLQKISLWIGKSIIDRIYIDSLETIYVKLRIVTCMLNKLVESKIISQQDGIDYQHNIVNNVLGLYSDLNTEDLPF